jgi:hypothetical protein
VIVDVFKNNKEMEKINEYYTEDLKSTELLEINGGAVDKGSFGYFLERLIGECICVAKDVLEALGPKPIK